MNVFHSEAVVNPDGNIIIHMPFPVGEKVDVVVVPSDEVVEDKLWKELSAKEFLKGYSGEDAAYDTYSL